MARGCPAITLFVRLADLFGWSRHVTLSPFLISKQLVNNAIDSEPAGLYSNLVHRKAILCQGRK